MPVASFQKFNQFVGDVGAKVHNLNADTLKVMLTLTAPVSTNAIKADLTDISSGNGYAAGGTASTSNTYVQTSGVGKLLSGDVTFTASGGAIANFRYATLYNDTPTSPAKPLIGFFDYGSTVTLATGESLLVDFDGSAGILTIT